MILGVVAFVVALLVSLAIHEAGHLVTAKKFGMKASQYFIGFGPTIWSRQRGETEYGFKALPLGGYVKIVGMTPLEEVDPADEPRAFYRQPGPQRAVVLAAGSVTHFVLAFVLLLVVAMGLGLPGEGQATATVGAVSKCVPSSPNAECTGTDRRSPAAQAGLRPGDRIVALDGREVAGWAELSRAIENHPAGPTEITVVRNGERVSLRANLTSSPAGSGSFLGIEPRIVYQEPQRLGPVDAAVFAGDMMGRMFVMVGQVLAELPAAIPHLFSEERGENGGGVGSIVGAAYVSGQAVAADAPARERAITFLSIVISLNLFVGVLNLLPLLPMDGGHLAVLLYERSRAGIARLRGRADPGPVDMRKLLPATYAVVVLLIGLGVLLILADIVNPLTLQ
ncbi:MAG: PDZ domain-containing protein [Streptosporangiales bacterium]|nr:PDZ domain-containing protein [Streptosporangiales bacterium]